MRRICHRYVTYDGDLEADLVARDRSVYHLDDRLGGSANDALGASMPKLTSEGFNRTWKLHVNDNFGGNNGRIDKRSIDFRSHGQLDDVQRPGFGRGVLPVPTCDPYNTVN